MKTKANPTSPSKPKAPAKRVTSAAQTLERDSDARLQAFIPLVASLRDAQGQKAAHYIPIARHLIESRSRNTQEIEHSLDHLLDIACLPEGLVAFKALCRHYWQLNPQATASYVHAYREMWDSEESPIQETTS